MIDVARLDQLRCHLREHPQYHKQRIFACGTSGCVAGWAIALDIGAHAGDNITRCITESDYDYRCAMDAQDLLGLSNNEADTLFYETMHRWLWISGEKAALRLIDALINREKDELTFVDRIFLKHYELPTTRGNDE